MPCRLPQWVPVRTGRFIQCHVCPSNLSPPISTRSFASSPVSHEDDTLPMRTTRPSHNPAPPSTPLDAQIPRYAQTPPRMKAPISVRRPLAGTRWECNEDPALLNHVYKAVLGDQGDRLLTEEVKWLAVTHKSFDQGRRGFNDRLAFLGRQIVSLQVSLALLNSTTTTTHIPIDLHAEHRTPFQHPGVDLLPKLTAVARNEVLDTHRMAKLASQMGLMKVIRWKPRDNHNLVWSGSEFVLSQALYAIIGAVALQRGGEVAIRAVKDRILSPLGLRS